MNPLLPLFSALVVGLNGAAHGEQTGDPAHGLDLYHVCAGCHEIGPGAENGPGPHLNDVIGRPAGSVPGYAYSVALRKARDRGLVWHEDTLRAYIARPDNVVPGTRMPYAGMKRPGDRLDLMAYLRSFSAAPERLVPVADGTAGDVAGAVEGDAEYGAFLAGECMTCHARDGADIPAIAGRPVADFVLAMVEYRDRVRTHPVMNTVANRLGDEEIAALAAFFATLDQ